MITPIRIHEAAVPEIKRAAIDMEISLVLLCYLINSDKDSPKRWFNIETSSERRNSDIFIVKSMIRFLKKFPAENIETDQPCTAVFVADPFPLMFFIK